MTELRCVEGKRLVYYKAEANSKFWEHHWETYISPEIYKGPSHGSFGFYEKPFTHYLPRHGQILEAGCGVGELVLALQARGYQAEGIEWSKETVEKVHALRPDISISVGDVTNLDVPDRHYAAYISLGVVEHFKEGPQTILNEAWRALKFGGMAFVAVPWFNPLRRLKARLGCYNGSPNSLAFYQYAFHEKEFSQILIKCGFEVIDKMSYSYVKGLKDELPIVRWMLQLPRFENQVNRVLSILLKRLSFLSQQIGHMLLVIAKKPMKVGK